MFWCSFHCYKATRLPLIFQTTSSLEATWKSSLQEITLDPEKYYRELLVYFTPPKIERIESLFTTIGEIDQWEKVINPVWAVFWRWRKPGSLRGPFLTLPPLHSSHKISALLRFLSCLHRSFAHTPLLERP